VQISNYTLDSVLGTLVQTIPDTQKMVQYKIYFNILKSVKILNLDSSATPSAMSYGNNKDPLYVPMVRPYYYGPFMQNGIFDSVSSTYQLYNISSKQATSNFLNTWFYFTITDPVPLTKEKIYE
jgi:hypothetical protein